MYFRIPSTEKQLPILLTQLVVFRMLAKSLSPLSYLEQQTWQQFQKSQSKRCWEKAKDRLAKEVLSPTAVTPNAVSKIGNAIQAFILSIAFLFVFLFPEVFPFLSDLLLVSFIFYRHLFTLCVLYSVITVKVECGRKRLVVDAVVRLHKLQSVFDKCICPICKKYLSKLQNVFVPITNCPNSEMQGYHSQG